MVYGMLIQLSRNPGRVSYSVVLDPMNCRNECSPVRARSCEVVISVVRGNISCNAVIAGRRVENRFPAIQTPQCFDRDTYLRVTEQLDPQKARLVTDDASLFELSGLPVRLTQGDYANYKITTREDLPDAPMQGETKMRIGHGYDVHRLVEDRPLILGGVNVPFEKGLLGHSDADVLTHAVMDAVLGAAALGDIGQHFPDNDPAYAGADSLALARAVAALVEKAGWKVGNIDATILCQRPKLAPHIPAMRQNLAAAFGLPVDAVSVKATTEEHLGFTGEGLGIAAHAVALILPL